MRKRVRADRLLRAFRRAGRRAHLVGTAEAGVIAALDLEGRLFTVLEGEVLNRVNLEAVAGQSTRTLYLNPGGDGLWPAPEGTTLGYQYATGAWRVPPGVRSARYLLAGVRDNGATMTAEVDLVNNQGAGLPALFGRRISVEPGPRKIKVSVIESIVYLGTRPLPAGEVSLAPWSLCQFDCGPGCEVVFPAEDRAAVWDLYDPPDLGQLVWEDGRCRAITDGSGRYQIALAPDIPWLEFRDPRAGLTVRRSAGPLPEGQAYVDIRDAPPAAPPAGKGVRYSVYSDTSGFMEIEAAGGCPRRLEPGAELKITVVTEFAKM
jgi:hypothetical protein